MQQPWLTIYKPQGQLGGNMSPKPHKREHTRIHQAQDQEASKVRWALSMIGGPTESKFTQMVRCNQFPNCNVTSGTIKAANIIIGPDLAGIRGKTTRKRPKVERNGKVEILTQIMEPNKLVWLAVDMMFVNWVEIVVMVSQGLSL